MNWKEFGQAGNDTAQKTTGLCGRLLVARQPRDVRAEGEGKQPLLARSQPPARLICQEPGADTHPGTATLHPQMPHSPLGIYSTNLKSHGKLYDRGDMVTWGSAALHRTARRSSAENQGDVEKHRCAATHHGSCKKKKGSSRRPTESGGSREGRSCGR